MKKIFLLAIVLSLIDCSFSIFPGETTYNVFSISSNETKYCCINSYGTAQGWIIITPRCFTIGPNGTEILISATIPKDVKPGTYELNLDIVSNNNIVETKKIYYNVENPHNIEIFPEKENFNVCLGDYLVFNVLIKNNGMFQEPIFLSGATFSDDFIILNPNESTIVTAFFYAQKSGINLIDIEAKYNEISSKKRVRVNVTSCQDFDFQIPIQVESCGGDSKEVTFYLKNKGTKKDTYFIQTNSILIRTPLIVELEPGEKFTGKILVNFPCEVGIYNTTITISSNKSNTKYYPFVIKVNDCDSPYILSNMSGDLLCSCENKKYEFKIINNGERIVSYSIKSDLIFSNLSKSMVTLGRGEEESFIMNINVPCNVSGVYNFNISAESLSTCPRKYSKQFNLVVYLLEECRKPGIFIEKNEWPLNEQVDIPIRITNLGIRPSNYTISLFGDTSPISSISKTQFYLEPGESEVIHLIGSSSKRTEFEFRVSSDFSSESIKITFGSNLLFIVAPVGILILSIILSLLSGKYILKIVKKRKYGKNKSKVIRKHSSSTK